MNVDLTTKSQHNDISKWIIVIYTPYKSSNPVWNDGSYNNRDFGFGSHNMNSINPLLSLLWPKNGRCGWISPNLEWNGIIYFK